MVSKIKEILDKSNQELLNTHIPEMSAMVTNKVMDVYELGVNTGKEIGEMDMLAKIEIYLNNIGMSNIINDMRKFINE
jgi:hypothetical protein